MLSSQKVTELADKTDSPLKDYHLYGGEHVKHYRIHGDKKSYQMEFEKDPYSQQQNFLFKRAVHGLGVYDKAEIKDMHWQKRKRIIKVHKRTQRVLNIWKQELTNIYTSYLFAEMLNDTQSFKQTLVEGSETDPEFKNTIPFATLGVDKDAIVAKLLSVGVLPSNFHSLTA